ncbi:MULTISPECIES: hypothetical protein [Exiguobacterium]|uniref:hypothetical protein n=1 Tax=Exiguobacterium sp. UBA1053 TaxID=1946487 RepID=UPI0025C3819B|nr:MULTISPECIES: hypothetical protein [Exiguobacterium]
MSNTTRWVDTTNVSLEGILSKFLSDIEPKESQEKISYINFSVSKEFEENNFFKFGNKQIEYNIINFSFDSVFPGVLPIEDRTTPTTGVIIVYTLVNKVNYIIDKNTDALMILRLLLGYKNKLEIEKKSSDIHSKLLTWIISRLFKEENELVMTISPEDEKTLTLNSMVGFKGQTDDQISFVSANGDSILNILSTLSFLLESKMLKQIKLRLEFDKHENLEINLKDTQTISANVNKYDGPFDEYSSKPQKMAEIYLLIYLEIMPLLYLEYQKDVENEMWGVKEQKEFLTLVKDKLIAKINEKTQLMDEQ